jgi:hypothetical protein
MMLFIPGIATGAIGAYTQNRTVMAAGFAIGVIALLAWMFRASRERRRDGSAGDADADIDMGHHPASRDAGDGPDGDH